MQLPALRADLQLSAAEPAHDGSPQWTLADPLRGRYFKLGQSAMRLLRCWHLGQPEQILQAANRESGAALDGSDLEGMLRFLRGHDLISASDAEQRSSYAGKAAMQRQSAWKQVLHNYLFFRIPLWRPDPFLARTWPVLERFGPGLLRWGLPLTLLLGIFLVLRDWPRFTASFPYLFSLGGLLAFGVALIFSKFCHEFGHAFMAKRAGCRVQSMGLAFMVLFPLFYTDVSDAWRVTERRSRLLIGAGGILAELLLASVALLAWSLLPDGPARTAAFMLATATWLTTLAVNLNPLMRFDGYFLIADYWGIDNLQGRAFALCRWRLREALFGFGEAPPEPLPERLKRRMLIWGYASWLWRAVLFFGIALMVYHLFFKVLGIFLMLVELSWFIGLPVYREMQEWWRRRALAQRNHQRRNLLLMTILLGLLLIPWRSSVSVPVMLEAEQVSALHAPIAARLQQQLVDEGDQVAAGQPLLQLESPDLDARLQIIRREIDILQLQLKRLSARSETAADSGILEQQLAAAVAEYRGLTAQQQRLQVIAPHAGQVRDLLPELTTGQWVAPQQVLARVVSPSARLRGYLPEDELSRIAVGAEGRFVSEDPARASLPVTLTDIDATGSEYLTLEALTSDQHGAIAARRGEHGLQPLHGQYAVRLVPLSPVPAPAQPLRGTVQLSGERSSVLSSLWRRVAALGVRESGF
ncbi:MAG: HlyD family efflux transporter periplasmic adaptor subunit [Pseudomonadaceae bacterium]